MRRSSLLLGTALMAILVAPAPEPAIAQCSGPYFDDIDNLVLTRGQTATIEGRSFVDGCQDTGSCSVGCNADCDYGPEPEPSTDITLQLVQRGHTWKLGVADADDDGRVTWTFEVPRRAQQGPAELLVDYATSATVRIR